MHSDHSTVASEQDKLDSHSSGPGLQHTSRRISKKRRTIIIVSVVVALVVILALAIGLGVGLSRKSGNSVAINSLPHGGDDDSQTGMQQSGTYFTSYDNTNNQFAWTPANFSLQSGAAPTQSAVIYVNGSQVGQTMDGFGASLSDASAQLFAELKVKDVVVYNSVMDTLFNRRTGMSIIRVPIGTTDFSPNDLQYTMADTEGNQAGANDTQGPLSNFNMQGADKYIIPFLQDALKRNGDLKISLLPWSPPAWMKTGNSVNAGSLKQGYSPLLAEYLIKSVQGFRDALGVTPWSLAVQNEPSNPTAYPSMSMDNNFEIAVLVLLRGRLAEVGLGSVQLWGHEDNFIGWSDAAALVRYNASMLDGISWHCYNGSPTLLSNYQSALTNVTNSAKSLHMTECSGQDTGGSGTSYNLRWWMNNIYNQPGLGVSSITSWNLALDKKNGPRLSRAYCKNCVGSIQINGGTVTSNIQNLLLAHHASAAANLTRFGGQPASRIQSSVTGDTNHCLASSLAFTARWSGSGNSQRVGLVVQNTCATQLSTAISLNGAQYFNINLGTGVTTIVLST